MRVTSRTRPPVHRRPEATDAGAVAVMVALLLPIVLALGALGVNSAAMWAERRHLFTATDAAALSAAVVRSEGGDAVAACRSYLAANHSTAAAASAQCELLENGVVRVTASARSPMFFLPEALGLDSTIRATSMAVGGPPRSIYGARPMALCWRTPELQEWLLTKDSTRRFPISPNDLCPGSPGNNDSHQVIEKAVSPLEASNNESSLNTLLGRGSDFPLSLCDTLDVREVWTNANKTDLPVAVGTTFPIAIFGYDVAPFNEAQLIGCDWSQVGGRTNFPVVGFIGMELHSAELKSGKWQFIVSFHELSVSGICCRAQPPTGVRTVALCHPTEGCRTS